MTEIVYVGPSATGVEIAESGQRALPGKPIEVESELAKRLLEQDTFERPKRKAAKKKAAPQPKAAPPAPADNTPGSGEGGEA